MRTGVPLPELTTDEMARMARLYRSKLNPDILPLPATHLMSYQDLAVKGWVSEYILSPYPTQSPRPVALVERTGDPPPRVEAHFLMLTDEGVKVLLQYSQLQWVLNMLSYGLMTDAIFYMDSLHREDLCELLTYPDPLIREIVTRKMALTEP